MTTSVYIAAPYVQRAEAQAVMVALEQRGIEITSSWLREHDELSDTYAQKDLSDIDRADILLALTPKEWVSQTGGCHVEYGYAIAKGKHLVVLGERKNIFHYLNSAIVVAWEPPFADLTVDLARLLRSLQPTYESAKLDGVLERVRREFLSATGRHKPMNGPHEGFGVCYEELDELWDEVKANNRPAQIKEAIQLAAMGMRYVHDLE